MVRFLETLASGASTIAAVLFVVGVVAVPTYQVRADGPITGECNGPAYCVEHYGEGWTCDPETHTCQAPPVSCQPPTMGNDCPGKNTYSDCVAAGCTGAAGLGCDCTYPSSVCTCP